MLTDTIHPTEGECFLNGVSTRRDRTTALAGAGVLIESPEIHPSLTPREALQMVADLRGVPGAEWRARIDTTLEEVRMSDWADQEVGRFSKGMKQRIHIAAALLHDPTVVLLDEPSSGLDPRGMAEVRSILRDLRRAHRLIFMSGHILSEVTDVCDEVALLDRGRLLFCDTLPNVIARFTPTQRAVDVTLARPLAGEALAGSIGRLPVVIAVRPRDARRLRRTSDGGIDDEERLLRALVGLDIGMAGFAAPESALEEVYLSQISRGE